MDALNFSDAVLDRRDLVTQTGGSAPTTSARPGGRVDTLAEIRDSVRNIEKLLERRRDGES